MWGWDNRVQRYRDVETGRFLPRTQILEFVTESMKATGIATDQLSSFVFNGITSPDDYRGLMRQELKLEYINQYRAGRGGQAQMTQEDWGSVGGMLGEQYGKMDGFIDEIIAGDLSEAQIQARARMYVNSSREAFERAHARNAAELGMNEELWVINQGSENCTDCLDNAAEGWQDFGHFSTPGDGSTICLCITTPWSMVVTKRGLIPMYVVKVGDEVLTHMNRYRQVTAVQIKPAMGARMAYIEAPSGEWVGCTADHLWHTDNGWLTASDIDNQLVSCYAIPNLIGGARHETVPEVREADLCRCEVGAMLGMSDGLPVWKQEGQAGRFLSILRRIEKSKGAMANGSGDNSCGYPQGWQVAANAPGGHCRTRKLATKDGWSILDILLGRGQEAGDLSLSVDVDVRVWPNTEGDGHTPYQRGSERRQTRESCINHGIGSCESPCGCAQLGPMEGPQNAGMDVQTMRRELPAFPEKARRYLSRAEVLLGGMLSEGAAVYDLQVVEDHSFVIAGLAAHNTNCQCHKLYRGGDAVL